MNKPIPSGSIPLAGHDMGFGNIGRQALMQGCDIYGEVDDTECHNTGGVETNDIIEEVDHPEHYNSGETEVIDIIEDWNLGFHDGNALKYIARHKHKENPEKDIEKAIWYLERHLENLRDKKNE